MKLKNRGQVDFLFAAEGMELIGKGRSRYTVVTAYPGMRRRSHWCGAATCSLSGAGANLGAKDLGRAKAGRLESPARGERAKRGLPEVQTTQRIQ